MTRERSVRCLCGAVTVTLQGEPAARANCHCQTCRDFYGTSMLLATAWGSGQLAVTGANATFAHPAKAMSRTFCASCGEIVFGTNRLGMRVVPNSLNARAHDGQLPDELQPTMHLFYRQRVIDVVDPLPKYLDGWDGPTLEAAS
ncbi:aldehyde-activating protein [Burkholderia ubonensis]|uniref:GFA family protein n=1 Tax=Burkholderia ubonensis TaxID=101571 RepID=UPI0007548A6E|nr:GFA family protein [Burkholderia ubonensis]KVO37910.1 aldehyde-activating protein [Burkholderia ubonensis]KVP33251.1 aldehyde-activating protein [Burkholderia ubonensis]